MRRVLNRAVLNTTLPPAGAQLAFMLVILAWLAWTIIATVGLRQLTSLIVCIVCQYQKQIGLKKRKKERRKVSLTGIITRDE